MKFKLVESLNSIKDMHNAIMSEFASPDPGPGCIFIAPDGNFIKIYPKLDDHEDLAYWLEEIGFDEDTVVEDAEWFVDEFNYVRCRDSQWIPLIQCPEKITSNQLISLEEWLENHVDAGVELEVTCGDQIKRYNTDDYFPEDIIKNIKRYYSSGKLYD